MANTGNPNSNSHSNKISHDNTSDTQSAPTLNRSDIQVQTITPPKDACKSDPSEHNNTNSIMNFDKKTTNYYGHRCFITFTLHNKILQELNLNGLYQHSNSCKVYIFKKSICIVNCSYVLIFLRLSTYYVIMPHTNQWYKINGNEILENHKLVLCDDQWTHMVPVPPAELPEINAFTTSTRLTFLQTQDKQVSSIYVQYIVLYVVIYH